MSRFNLRLNKTAQPTIINHQAGVAFTQAPELELASIMLTSTLEPDFYRAANQTVDRMIELVSAVDPELCAKVAIYSRSRFGMRSTSHVVAAELAARVKGQKWFTDFIDQVVIRPDDASEITAYWLAKYGKPFPNNLKKGISRALGKFDTYQIAKYRSSDSQVSLVDVVNLVHPKPTQKNADALKSLVAGTLRSERTWENELSAAGPNQKKRNAVWTELIESGDIGYFALLKNLRNIMIDAPEMLEAACSLLIDKNRIAKSKVLPFRYITALKNIQSVPGMGDVVVAISDALELSIDNIKPFAGKTLIAVDTSGSMTGRPAEIATLFAALFLKKCKADILSFDEKVQMLSLNKRDSALTIARSIPILGGGTNFEIIFDSLSVKYDRIVILSDMQAMDGATYAAYGGGNTMRALNDYRSRTGAGPMVYSFDLAGYGSMKFPSRETVSIAGFSEKTLDIMHVLESGKTLIEHITEEIQLGQ
jgi:60 kDa SS-A/Ro ribonucleoprotein